MKRIALIGVALLVSSPALAQVTTCNRIGNSVVCNTQQPYTPPPIVQPAPLPDFAGIAIQARAAREAREAREAAQQAEQIQARHDREQAYMKSEVSKMILAGHCDEAKTMALKYDNLDVAEQAVRICIPAAQ